jgi:hypothetical protein
LTPIICGVHVLPPSIVRTTTPLPVEYLPTTMPTCDVAHDAL